MFDQFPVLQQAHNIIRASRSSAYFEKGDWFSTAIVQPLHVTGSIGLLSGTNMSALDKLFEEAPDRQCLKSLAEEIQTLTHLGPAQRFKPNHWSLKEAVKTQVAFLTTHGVSQLRNTAWQKSWLKSWQSSMLKQNRQQVAHCAAALAIDYRPPVTPDFGRAADVYLKQFGETSALAITVIGAVPFSAYAGAELHQDILTVLQYLAPLFRMAQDSTVDTTERLNLGIFATASVHSLTAHQARVLIQDGFFPDLSWQLRRLYQQQLDQTQKALLNRRLCAGTQAFCQASLAIASKLAQQPN